MGLGRPLKVCTVAAFVSACADGGQEFDTDGAPVSTTVVRSQHSSAPTKVLDLLVVIDDSASMHGEQATLAANLGAFIDLLEDPEIDADYRVAVLRGSGSLCDSAPAEPVATSCRERLGDFVIGEGRESAAGQFEVHCTAACPAASLTMAPTRLHADDEARPRPWLQRYVDAETMGPSTSLPARDALACMGMVGVSGCDYESPFEVIAAALDQFDDPTAPLFGFARPHAHLAVLVITDEDDCSALDPSIFDAAGERTFWPPETTGDRAPSAVCFRAGSQCTPDGAGNLACSALDRDAQGQPAAPGDAVLMPVEALASKLQALATQKRDAGFDTSVALALVAGVDAQGEASWPTLPPDADAFTIDFAREFGAGPTCDIQTAAGPRPQALAPPRWLALRDRLSPEPDPEPGSEAVTSSCANDYTQALAPSARRPIEPLRPWCFEDCAFDEDPTQPGRQVACTVTARLTDDFGTEHAIEVPECVRAEDGYTVDPVSRDYQIPSGATSCFAARTDVTGLASEDPNDDTSEACAEQGASIEFAVTVAPNDRFARYQRHYTAACLVDVSPGACAAASP